MNGVIHVIDKVLWPPPAALDPATEIRAMAPLSFFDPAGFSKAGNQTGFNKQAWPPAMMAALGTVLQHYEVDFADT